MVSVLIWAGCQKSNQNFVVARDGSMAPVVTPDLPRDHDHDHDHDHEREHDLDDDSRNVSAPGLVIPFSCKKASSAEEDFIDQGNSKLSQFMQACWEATGTSSWCEQLTRPNPSSRQMFICTYGEDRPHQLIHPDESTWGNAFKAVELIRDLEASGISVAQIYNWWRPEPYNDNVGGAAGRHPFGTSVDVKFSSKREMEKAHRKLCEFRKKGRLRALGYYGTTGLHLGIGDTKPNTWGKSCP
jgi:hypothetical protein